MNKPYKIIYKVKNFNKEYQYYLYIFVGYNIDKKIKFILNKIKELDFYNTLIKLNTDEYKHMESNYGVRWYEYFFLSGHISNSIKLINKISNKLNELKKYGNDWIKEHIENNLNKKR